MVAPIPSSIYQVYLFPRIPKAIYWLCPISTCLRVYVLSYQRLVPIPTCLRVCVLIPETHCCHLLYHTRKIVCFDHYLIPETFVLVSLIFITGKISLLASPLSHSRGPLLAVIIPSGISSYESFNSCSLFRDRL